MKLGGYSTAKDAGLRLDRRDVLYARIRELGEGAIFTAPDIVQEPEDAEDFSAMRGHDYIHVIDGHLAGIVETRYLRRLPRLSLFLDAYCALRNCRIFETGDRIAWRLGLKEWEPIEGYRYYSSGPDEVLSFGHMKIWMLGAEGWRLDDTSPARLFRAFLDLPPKDRETAFARRRHIARIPDIEMQAAMTWAHEHIDSDDVEENSPAAVLAEMAEHLRNKDEAV